MKYLEIGVNKEMKYLYTKNCKTLVKESKEDTQKWRNILGSWVRKINIV